MTNPVRRFFSEADQERIRGCVREIEKTTSGELVPMIVPASSHYPGAGALGAMVAGFAVAFLADVALGFARLWRGFQPLDIWLFPAVFGLVFFAVLALEHLFPSLKRPFIHDADSLSEVAEAAFAAFYRHGLAHTRDRTGVLIFISIFERKVHVIADEGIHAKVGEESWKRAVELIVSGFKNGRPAEAVCEAIVYCGKLLAEHFPRKRDDTDELDDLIVEQ